MNDVVTSRVLSIALAAFTPAAVVGLVQGQPEHEEGCSGCEAKYSVVTYKRSAPNGVPIWEAASGVIDVGEAAEIEPKNGRCKRKRDGDSTLDECDPDPDWPCNSNVEAVINGVTPNTYISGTAWTGCESFAAASDEHKKLSAQVTQCGASVTDEVQAHNSANCLVALTSTKVELKVWCEPCRYSAQ